MSYPLGTTAVQLSQAVGEPCLISNAGSADLYLAAGSYVGPNAYDVRLPVGSSLQWGGGTLWGVATGPGGAYAVLYTPGGVGGGVVNGATVPVPPSAAAIGQAVGGSVPVPPSAAAIGQAMPVPPSAAAVATNIYNQGIRAVDAPTRITSALYRTTGLDSFTVDISQASSVDIAWFWYAGVARAAGSRVWGNLRLDWLDSNGNNVTTDSFELSNENATTAGGRSHAATIRTPALGSSLKITLTDNQWGAPGLPLAPAASADNALVQVLLSNRATDRTRYTPAFLSNGGFVGVLYGGFGAQTVAAGAVTLRNTLEAFSGPFELRFLATGASGVLRLYSGAVGDGGGSYSHFVPMTAGTRYVLTVPGIRSQYTVEFVNQGTVNANFYMQAVASDN